MNGFSLQICKRYKRTKELCYCILHVGHFPMNPLEFPGEEAVNTVLWKLIPSRGLASFHQESWWFMSTTANQGAICLRQFLSSHLFFSRTYTHILLLYMKSYPLFSQQSGGFYRWPLQASPAFAAKARRRPLTWWMVLDDEPWALHSASRVIAVLIMSNLQWTFHLWRYEAAANWARWKHNGRTTLMEHLQQCLNCMY